MTDDKPDFTGRFTYGTPHIHRYDKTTRLIIGSFCSISGDVHILLGGEHRPDWVTTYPFTMLMPDHTRGITGHPTSRGDIVIGNDVWIGAGVMILSGVRIGHGAVIGAGCVVTQPVEPYCIVAGNSQRVLRTRFSQAQIDALLKIAWWDWPLESIIEALPLLLSKNIDAFLIRYGQEAVP